MFKMIDVLKLFLFISSKSKDLYFIIGNVDFYKITFIPLRKIYEFIE